MGSLRFHDIPAVLVTLGCLRQPLVESTTTRQLSIRNRGATPTSALVVYQDASPCGLNIARLRKCSSVRVLSLLTGEVLGLFMKYNTISSLSISRSASPEVSYPFEIQNASLRLLRVHPVRLLCSRCNFADESYVSSANYMLNRARCASTADMTPGHHSTI